MSRLLGMYTFGVGPELAGYLANDPSAGINSPDVFIFGHAGRRQPVLSGRTPGCYSLACVAFFCNPQ